MDLKVACLDIIVKYYSYIELDASVRQPGKAKRKLFIKMLASLIRICDFIRNENEKYSFSEKCTFVYSVKLFVS